MAAPGGYDRDTGQVFRQRDVPMPRAMSEPWNYKNHPTRQRLLVADEGRASGPAGLVATCIKVAAQHTNELDEEHLRSLPGPLVARIWQHATRTGAMSVEAWKLMATRIVKDDASARFASRLLMRHVVLVDKMQPLAAYVEPLISNSFDFLTHLTISGIVRGDTPELLHLTRLRNLAVLEIIEPAVDEGSSWRLTDSIVREWSRSPDPFPVLRVLRVWGNDHTTMSSFKYLNAFPSLILYDVAGRDRDWMRTGEKSVWRSRRRAWERNLDSSLIKQRLFFEEWIPHSGQTSEHQFNLLRWCGSASLLHAFRERHSALTRFRRDDHNSYKEALWQERGITAALGSPPREVKCPSSHLSPSECLDSENLWGFLVYCHIGERLADKDLLSRGLDIGDHAFMFDDIVLPPRPMLNLILGDTADGSGEGRRGLSGREGFEAHYTYIRDFNRETQEGSESSTAGSEPTKRPRKSSTVNRVPRKKSRDVSGILDSFC
ncbi:putative succinyl-3-ketoacid-coenzyme a transferase [Rosellinia necatrix]|uniref:Putative succinyl-3-ketoacid-coenzyme a transferase n=1 Tax=Rosellinia necatrix TaxID=77044 RepID=A0A1W2TNE8_ROSNE|nr:putative succinyl-3-ketoacid-coenzyme a transferase [Rosellinia necatrix]